MNLVHSLKPKLTAVSWFLTADHKPRRRAERSGWRSAPPMNIAASWFASRSVLAKRALRAWV